jgi:hypothetical protein
VICSGRRAGHDLEGIVGKWAHGPYYDDGVSTSWIKVKNPDNTRSVGRRELFERGRSTRRHRREFRAPILRLQPSDAGEERRRLMAADIRRNPPLVAAVAALAGKVGRASPSPI